MCSDSPQYPHEKECLFAPLTGLEVQDTRIDGSVLIVEARLSVNLNALTIEQVVSKRRVLIDQMVGQIRDLVGQELKGTGFEEGGLARLDAEVSAKRRDEADWYNEDANFKTAVDFVLDAKAVALGPARLEWIAGLPVAEAEKHTEFMLECARSKDERVVRAAERVTLARKHGPDGPSLWHLYNEGGGEAWAWTDRLWFDKEDNVSKWHGVTVDGAGRVVGIDFREASLGTAGAHALASVVPDMTSVTECNVRGNRLNADSAKELAKIATEKRVTLFGIHHGQTEADFRNQRLGSVDAILIANDLAVTASLTSVRALRNIVGVVGSGRVSSHRPCLLCR